MTDERRIRVPADLEAVTDRADEDHSEVDSVAVERIWDAARHWYAAGMQPAIQVCLRRNGKVILDRAIGHGWGTGPADPVDAEQIPVRTSGQGDHHHGDPHAGRARRLLAGRPGV